MIHSVILSSTTNELGVVIPECIGGELLRTSILKISQELKTCNSEGNFVQPIAKQQHVPAPRMLFVDDGNYFALTGMMFDGNMSFQAF